MRDVRPSDQPIVAMGLPLKTFLYTLDQIAMLTQIDLRTLRSDYVHYDGRSIGFREHGRFLARNIAEPGQTPDWRVAESELIRWLRYKGFRIHTRSSVVS